MDSIIESSTQEQPVDFDQVQIDDVQSPVYEDGYVGRCDASLFDDFKYGNKRQKRSAKSLASLTESIKKNGIIQPVVARPHATDPNRLELLAGFGRRDIAIALNLDVPFLLRVVDDQRAYEIHLAENLDREDLGIVDQARAASEFMSLYQGDYAATADRLNMSVTKLRERLELNRCSNKVLDALSEDKIRAAHAIILSPFPITRQDLTLDKIINEQWSVKELRERAGKALIPLSFAKFDTQPCSECEHNSIHQQGLFDNVDAKAKCGSNTCFRQKQAEWLQDTKAMAAEQYGTVLFLSESHPDDRNHVTTEQVGFEQMQICNTCESKIAVMDDSWTNEGKISTNQCVDKPCYTDCLHEQHPELAPAVEETDEQATDSEAVDTTDVAPTTPKKGASKKAKVSAKGIEVHEKVLRVAATNHFKDSGHFSAAVAFASLASTVGYTIDDAQSGAFNSLLNYALEHLTIHQIQTETANVANYMLDGSSMSCHGTSVEKILIKALQIEHANEQLIEEAQRPDAVKQAVYHAWTVTEENLSIYTIDQLKAVGDEIGIKAHMEDADKGSYNKLLKTGKKAIIKEFISIGSTISHNAPLNYLALAGV